MHRDLKPENILLENRGNISSIKLIDFGTALKLKQLEIKSDIVGTAYYVAPEVINGIYDERCDIWSCGIIMFILLSGTAPFEG